MEALHTMTSHLKIVGLLAVTLLPSCATLKRWEEHKKENMEPTDAKIEVPFDQNREPGRDDPSQSRFQIYGDRTTPPPQVVETFADPNQPTVLVGIPLEGKPGFVLSPYAPDRGLVDVSGFPPGTDVRDPYTGNIMRVPPPANLPPAEDPNKNAANPNLPVIPQVEP